MPGKSILLLLGLFVVAVACFKTGDEIDDSACIEELQSRQVTWVGDVLPVIQVSCQNCHGSTPQAPATQNLTVAATVQAYFNPANDTNGPGLMARLTTNNKRMPPDGGLGPCDVEKFRKWQSDGFLP